VPFASTGVGALWNGNPPQTFVNTGQLGGIRRYRLIEPPKGPVFATAADQKAPNTPTSENKQ
jgi:hypothetical protein